MSHLHKIQVEDSQIKEPLLFKKFRNGFHFFQFDKGNHVAGNLQTLKKTFISNNLIIGLVFD